MATNISLDTGENITRLLEKLAQTIGTTVDKVFPWYVKQQIIEGWCYLGGCFLSLMVGITLLLIAKKVHSEDGDEIPYLIVGALITVVGFIALVIGGATFMSQIINPEYHAMKEIIRQLK